MPSAPPRACMFPGCPNLDCTEHRPVRVRDVGRNRLYASARWRNLRASVLREHPWCSELGCLELATDVDHITPLAQGGAPYVRANLQPLCKSHHSQKTRAEGAAPR